MTINRTLAVLLAVSVLLNVLLGCGWANAIEDGGAAKQARADVTDTANANATKVQTVAAVATECAERTGATADAGAQAVAQRDEIHARIDDAAQRERQERESLYATDDDCAALARVPVCPALADRLRSRSRGTH